MIDFFVDLGSAIMTPLYYVTSFLLVTFHRLFGDIFGEDSGVSWVLSIIGLTVVIRAALIPLFVKQIKSSRNMQMLQPKVKELQKKYGHDRERLTQETMALYKETGTNPFASCLPLILQMPIFLALFRLIDHAAKNPEEGRALLTPDLAQKFSDAKLFGAKISDTFTGTDLTEVRILAGVLVLAMTATTFLTQRQLMSKNMPADAMTGQYAQQQKMLLYVLPVVFAVGGIAFPIGVLLYWSTSNLWTMGQQFYVIRNNPTPGTPAFGAKAEREAARRRRKGLPDPAAPADESETGADGSVATEPPVVEPPKRQQPKKQPRSQRKKQGPPSAKPPQTKPRAAGNPRNPSSPKGTGSTAKGSGKRGSNAKRSGLPPEADTPGPSTA